MTQQVPEYISAENLADYRQMDNAVLLDVRDERSFQQNHLPDAVSMSPNTLAAEINHMDDDKHYIVICYHGIMAVSVANFMQAHGLKASVLKGGMAAVAEF